MAEAAGPRVRRVAALLVGRPSTVAPAAGVVFQVGSLPHTTSAVGRVPGISDRERTNAGTIRASMAVRSIVTAGATAGVTAGAMAGATAGLTPWGSTPPGVAGAAG